MKLGKSNISILIFLFSITTAFAQYNAPGTEGNVTISGTNIIGGSGTITFNQLTLDPNSTLTIPAGVTVIVNDRFRMQPKAEIVLNGVLRLNGNDNRVQPNGEIDGAGALFADNGIDNKGSVFGNTDNNVNCTSGCGNTTLPVELMYFEGEFDNNVVLTWSTATEINNEYFSLERSEDGADFYEIARIEGNGNTTEVIEYEYTDDTYKASVEYYRLKQVDYDGQYEIFKSVRVETNAGNTKNEFTLFPTVVSQGKVTIQGEKPFQIKYIQVYSLSGTSNSIYQPNTSEVGSQRVEVNMNGLGNGLYLIKMISDAGDEFTSRIVVQ